MSPSARAAEQRIDLDGNQANGDESRVVTRVVQSFPVQVENTIYNNAATEFIFKWPGAGPGGFNSYVTLGPGVGTIWLWTSVSQVYSISSPITFTPTRSVPVVGGSTGGVSVPGSSTGSFIVPGKSLNPTDVTVSTASLSSSLITFFSPPHTVALCETSCSDIECKVSLHNQSNGNITAMQRQPGCCMEPHQIICDNDCRSYLTDTDNCGGCGNQCAADEICSAGECVCPPGEAQCGAGCVDLASDPDNCGTCGNACLDVQSCAGGACLCPEGGAQCGSECVDLANDPDHCGGCDTVCNGDQFCSGGTCACLDEGLVNCDGACVDLQNDDANCGGCGVACASDAFCSGGTCQSVCPAGTTLCGEECVDLTSDPSHCGSCTNACGANAICQTGSCQACRPPNGTACGNQCVNLHTDPNNCGACGHACDFSGCPSAGQGTCSQGTSCVCTSASGALTRIRFQPVPTTYETGQSIAIAPRRERAERVARRTGPVSVPQDPAPAPETATTTSGSAVLSNVTAPSAPAPLAEVVEAPICDFAPIEQVIGPGGVYVQSLPSGRFGREIQTSVSIAIDGQEVAHGPCPVIVPVTNADTSGAILSPRKVFTNDSSGDGLCQPEEARCDYFIDVADVGDTGCVSPLATLTSPPDQYNPNGVIFLNATSSYPTLPGYPGDGVPLTSGRNETAFSLTTQQTGQAPDVGRVFVMSVDCANLQDAVLMPIVLGIGDVCDPATDLDGETYDGVEGLKDPLNAKLVPQGNPVNVSTGNFKKGSTVPLKLTLRCGSRILTGADLASNPEVVWLIHATLGPQPLAGINGDNGANPDDPKFACGASRCEYQLRTDTLPLGQYVIGISMPDSRVFEAGFILKP